MILKQYFFAFAGLVAACLVALLLIAAPAQATIAVSFDGQTSRFNPGPFASFTPFTGSLEIDETIVPTESGGSYLWTGAVTALSITFQGFAPLTGGGGNIRQVPLTSGEDAILISVGASDPGSVGGSVFVPYGGGTGDFDFASFNMELRGPNLYDTAAMLRGDFMGLLGNPDTDDVNWRTLDLRFTGPDDSTIIERLSITRDYAVTFGPAGQVIPAPATLSLFLLGLAGIAGLRRRRREDPGIRPARLPAE